jgi:hypothetical protein
MFPVQNPLRVALVSGESGQATLKETALRVIARRVDVNEVHSRLQWCFQLPQFAKLDEMALFAARLKSLAVNVVFIDPVLRRWCRAGGACLAVRSPTNRVLRPRD